MSTRYRRVSQEDHTAAGGTDASKKARAEHIDRLTARVHGLVWVAAAICTLVFTNFFDVALHDHRVSRPYFNIGLICFVANICIALYLTIWIPLVLKVTLPWDVYCPRMIPTATLLGVVCGFMFIFAFWSVWGLLTPLILIVLFFGMLFSTHFIPWPC